MKNFKLPIVQLPENEDKRLQKLYEYDILDTAAERAFDKIASLAARIFNTPAAQISFVADERVFLKSNIGSVFPTAIKRKDSFCSFAILNTEITIIEDTHQLPQFDIDFPIMKQSGIRFYAGAPLRTSDGLQLGTICILDMQPREVDPQQIQMLETLASLIIDELELRKLAKKAKSLPKDKIQRIVHDLKNPAMTISLSTELLKQKADNSKIVSTVAERIKNAANKIVNELDKLLTLSTDENETL